jgi:hypothetical protein
MLKLIQKINSKIVMINMCTCVILLLFRLAANMFMNNIQIIAEIRLNLTNSRIEIYPAEGLMLKATVALFPLMVSCSKSQITVDAGRYTQCRSSNVHREVDVADPRTEEEEAPLGRRRRERRGR